MKKIGSMTLALLLALSLGQPFPALAQVKTWDQPNGEAPHFYRFTTWDSELPPVLQQPLKEAGYGALPCLSGAMFEMVLNEKHNLEIITALVALEGASGPVAIGMTCGPDAREWALDDMGSKAFLPGQAFTVQAFAEEQPVRPCLAVEYAAPGGGVARYEFRPENGSRRPWSICGYTLQDARGQGIQIVHGYPEYGFRVRPFPQTEDRGTYYLAFTPLLVRYMKGGIADYPTTEAQAREISQATQPPLEGQKLALLVGANLREKPTGSSKSLGFCQSGALAQVLGQEKGKIFPWIHLRVGNVEGYMSGIYVKQVGDEDFFHELYRMPPPLAKAKMACALRETAGEMAKEVSRLPAGTLMHVLAVTANGYYQVMVPREEPDWIMDLEGTSGYVKADEVEVVSSVIEK